MVSTRLKLVLMLSILILAACTKSNDNSQTIQARTSRGVYSPLAPQVDPVTGKSYPVLTSYVVGDGSNPTAYQAMIKQLVAPQIDSQFVGDVDFNTGVVMEAKVALNLTTGAVIPAQSRVVLQISDQYTGGVDSATGQSIPAITMVVPGVSGTNNGGQYQVTFQDCAGQIQITGGVVGANFIGNVYFTNLKKADCSTPLPGANQSYFLGSFQVPTCGFMTCKQ